MIKSKNKSKRSGRGLGRSSNAGSSTQSDGFGNSALANKVRGITQNTNSVLASRGSNQRFNVQTGKAYNVDQTIPAENINNTPAVNIPTPAPIQDPGPLAYSNNFGLSTPTNPVDPQTGLFQIGQPQGQTGAPANDYGAGLFNDYINAKGAIEPVSQEDIYRKSMKDSGLDRARQEVNNYSSQLNAITTKAQAESLALEGQGRGITESIIGGQQAQINREAAIQALPIQGQLAAAQGNLELAQQHFSDLFKIRTADAQSVYDYKNKVVDAVYQFATQAQQARLEELRYNATLARDDKKSNISRQDSYSSIALQNGQTQLAGDIAKLDPNDPAFGSLLAAKITQLKQQGAADRALTLEESAKFGLPVGTMLSSLSGQTLGGGVNPEIQKENDQDYQFAKLARDNAMAVVFKATGKSRIEDLTEADMAKLDDTQALNVSKALSITVNPKATKATGAEDALGPTGYIQEFTNSVRQAITKQKYSPKNLLDAVKTIESNFKNIQAGASGQPKTDPYAGYRNQIPAGQILIERNGEVGYVPLNEFNPSTDKKL